MKLVLSTLSILLVLPGFAQTRYELDLAARDSHQVAITAEYQAVAGEPLVLRMASASPGRYARHDFAKNIYALEAADGEGRPLQLQRTGPSSWEVSGHDGRVTVRYLLFGNRADGTYNQIDSRHVHLNMPASFLFAPALAGEEVKLRLEALPPDWRLASQLMAEEDGGFAAPDFDYFMDSPLEISAHQLLSFVQRSAGKDYRIELALHHQGTAAEADVLLEKIKAVVTQQQAIFGELPDFDDQRYTFIADYLPGVDGDGMEHRNSTILTNGASLAQREYEQIGTISHEFFHAWNVERIRPVGLEPFDYTQTNMSDALWFAEGFTSYYGRLVLKRSGHASLEDYLERLTEPLNRTLQAPGRSWSGPAAMSQQAVFVDAGVSVDANNFGNSFLSYYTYGEVVALALDLTLRSRFGTDLDALMRLMWQRFGKSETPYQLADIQQALADVTGDSDFAAAFFAGSIHGPSLPDFAPLFSHVGLTLAPQDADKAWLGSLQLSTFGDAVKVDSLPQHGSPWAGTGVTAGDLLLQLGAVRLRSPDDLAVVLKTATPGDQLVLKLRRYDQEQTLSLTVGADPALRLSVDPEAERSAEKALEDWLGEKAL